MLDLSYNNYSGDVLRHLSNLPSLRILNLGFNNILAVEGSWLSASASLLFSDYNDYIVKLEKCQEELKKASSLSIEGHSAHSSQIRLDIVTNNAGELILPQVKSNVIGETIPTINPFAKLTGLSLEGNGLGKDRGFLYVLGSLPLYYISPKYSLETLNLAKNNIKTEAPKGLSGKETKFERN